jgi:hypothetical protein
VDVFGLLELPEEVVELYHSILAIVGKAQTMTRDKSPGVRARPLHLADS